MNSPPRSLRFLFIALAGLSLLLGIWVGVARLGFAVALPGPEMITLHGPLMVIGFLLMLIGLERAAAVNRWWVYGVPLLSVMGLFSLLIGLPGIVAPWFATGAALLLTGFFLELFRQQREEHFIIMALSAVVLCVGNLLWLGATNLSHIVPWWAAFLILMIAGERLELTRLRAPTPWVRAWFRLAVVIFVAGLMISVWQFRPGVRIAGIGMIALGLWLLRYDLAWQNLAQPGLPRFIAVNLIAGYFWLAIGAICWIWFARFFGAGPLYDAMLHTVFVGFVFAMIFAHGPLIFPSITDLPLPFHRAFYAHTGMLQIALLVRVAGDLGFLPYGQKWGGLLNALAILLFLFNSLRAASSAQ